MPRRNVITSFLAAAAVALGLAGTASATTTPTNIPNSMYDQAGTTQAAQLVERVDDALNALTYTYWRLGNDYFDAIKGVYKIDCSGYLNRMVEDSNPTPFDAAQEARDTKDLRSDDWYALFKSIPYGETRNKWKRVKKVTDLRPGDVLVYKGSEGEGTTGHSMIVVGRPERDTRWSNTYKIRVSDSAKSGHSTDNRGASGSGVGAGILLLKANSSTGELSGLAWSLKGYWKSGIKLAAGRPTR